MPEILALLGRAVGRRVPKSDREEARVQRLYREIGPVARIPAEEAFQAIATDLGPGRPLKAYLDALRERLVSPATTPKKRRRSAAKQRKKKR